MKITGEESWWSVNRPLTVAVLSAAMALSPCSDLSALDFMEDFASANLDGWAAMGAAKCVIAPNEGRAGGAGAVTLAGRNGCGLCRSLPTGPGAYEFTYWTRPVNVKGEIGVRGGVEFYDKDGKFVHPYFYATPQGAPDAFGWYKVVIKIPRMPERAARVSMFLQVAPGSTGIAYFDDVSLRPAVSPLLAVMTSPRNQTAAPGDRRLKN